MEFEGVFYTNLARRTQRDLILNYILDCQGFPDDKIFRLEGIDAADFESNADVISSYLETYPELAVFGQDPLHPFKSDLKGNICCVIAWKNALTRIYNDLSDTGMALYLLDDVFVAKPFWAFRNMICGFNDDVDIVQLFTWESEIYLQRPKCPENISKIYEDLLVGCHKPGDTALLLSKRGAKNILDVYREEPWTCFFPETIFFDCPEKFENFYSIKFPHLWVKLPSVKYSYSDRENENKYEI